LYIARYAVLIRLYNQHIRCDLKKVLCYG